MEFNAFERAVIEVILSQAIEGMDILRKQFATASVVESAADMVSLRRCRWIDRCRRHHAARDSSWAFKSGPLGWHSQLPANQSSSN
jgi:hypothetical protein